MLEKNVLPIKISVVSNVIFEPHCIPLMALHFGNEVELTPIPYGEHNEKEYKDRFSKADLIVVWLNFEELSPDVLSRMDSGAILEQQVLEGTVSVCVRLYTDISADTDAQMLWFLFEDCYIQTPITAGHRYNRIIDKINLRLTELLCDTATIIDLKHLIAEVGVTNAYDPKGKYRWNAPYSKALVEVAVKEIYKQYLIEKGNTKKCLVLDCDNVLWGGILSEDGMENLKLGGSGFGRAYQDFQRFILSLYYHGVILAVCSKNDLSDVMTMFHEHSEMVLKEEHIACFQVNWENKPDNINWIADTLNIGLDSMVFVDDSPLEIEAVKSMLPEVTTIRYEHSRAYKHFSCFNLKSSVNIENIEKRNKTYRTNQSRETLKSQYKSYDEYIAALEMKTDIHEVLPIEYSRIAELTQRTNKCTNGKRYTVAEIKDRITCENVKIYSLSVSDRFSDLGLVGALEIDSNILILFCLSCRSLGREIENRLLKFIADKHQINKIEFKSTGKNEDVKTLLVENFPNVALTNCENECSEYDKKSIESN